MDLNCYKKKKLPPQYTEMFRDIKVWKKLERILKENNQECYNHKENINFLNSSQLRVFRVWSAGCASGEEAYSLQKMLQRVFVNKQVHWKIYASDINNSFQNKINFDIPDEITNLRGNKIRWKIHNLVDDPGLSLMSLILCRNVLMFFTLEYQEIILDKLYQSLRSGGYLVLGKVESLRGNRAKKLKIIDNKLKIYQKI